MVLVFKPTDYMIGNKLINLGENSIISGKYAEELKNATIATDTKITLNAHIDIGYMYESQDTYIKNESGLYINSSNGCIEDDFISIKDATITITDGNETYASSCEFGADENYTKIRQCILNGIPGDEQFEKAKGGDSLSITDTYRYGGLCIYGKLSSAEGDTIFDTDWDSNYSYQVTTSLEGTDFATYDELTTTEGTLMWMHPGWDGSESDLEKYLSSNGSFSKDYYKAVLAFSEGYAKIIDRDQGLVDYYNSLNKTKSNDAIVYASAIAVVILIIALAAMAYMYKNKKC